MANFVVSGTPHVRSKESIQSIMRDVIIALVPATAAGIYYFGMNALVLVIAAIVSAVAFEALCQKVMKKPVTVSDLSAVVDTANERISGFNAVKNFLCHAKLPPKIIQLSRRCHPRKEWCTQHRRA